MFLIPRRSGHLSPRVDMLPDWELPISTETIGMILSLRMVMTSSASQFQCITITATAPSPLCHHGTAAMWITTAICPWEILTATICPTWRFPSSLDRVVSMNPAAQRFISILATLWNHCPPTVPQTAFLLSPAPWVMQTVTGIWIWRWLGDSLTISE